MIISQFISKVNENSIVSSQFEDIPPQKNISNIVFKGHFVVLISVIFTIMLECWTKVELGSFYGIFSCICLACRHKCVCVFVQRQSRWPTELLSLERYSLKGYALI